MPAAYFPDLSLFFINDVAAETFKRPLCNLVREMLLDAVMKKQCPRVGSKSESQWESQIQGKVAVDEHVVSRLIPPALIA